MYTTDFAFDGPIFLVPLSPSYPSSPVLLSIFITLYKLQLLVALCKYKGISCTYVFSILFEFQLVRQVDYDFNLPSSHFHLPWKVSGQAPLSETLLAIANLRFTLKLGEI